MGDLIEHLWGLDVLRMPRHMRGGGRSCPIPSSR